MPVAPPAALVLASALPGVGVVVAVDGPPPLSWPNREHLLRLLAEETGGADADPVAADADWPALLADPNRFRGVALRLDARSAGRRRDAEAGGVPLHEWGLVADTARADLPLVVYLPRRSGGDAAPAAGRRVMGTARFLALWEDADAAGTPRRYPVLVADRLVVEAPVAAEPNAASRIPALTAAAVALTGLAWWLARRNRRGPNRGPSTHPRLPRVHRPAEGEGLAGSTEPLPADPAEALARLAGAAETAEADEKSRTPPPAGS